MPHFFMIEGNLGAGKTLIASVLAHYWRLRSGGAAQIFANYDLKGAQPFNSASKWLDVAEARGSICIWDEAQSQFDRRTWARNTFMSQIFNLTRKLRCVQMFINPVGNNLDSRILDLVEIFIRVRKVPNRFIALDVFEYPDKRFGPWGRYIKTLTIPWHKVKKIFALELYDTDQLLYGFSVPKTERQQAELIEKIIEVQQEAVRAEKKGNTVGGGLVGWINPSEYNKQRQDEPDAISLFVSEHSDGTDSKNDAGVLSQAIFESDQ